MSWDDKVEARNTAETIVNMLLHMNLLPTWEDLGFRLQDRYLDDVRDVILAVYST
jgi:hypothetical protein